MKGEIRHSYRFKAFRLEVEERQLLHNDHPVPLTPKAFDVLVALVERSGHLVEKDELMRTVWSDSFVEEANVSRLVHTLRKVLGDDGNGNKFIETVAKKGYRFVTEVNKIENPITPGAANGNANSSHTDRFAETAVHSPAVAAKNGEAAESRITSEKKTAAKRFLSATTLIALICTGVFLAFAAWFFLPKLFANRTLTFQTIQTSRLTDTGTATLGEISPDGRFVAFINRKDGTESLAVRQVATGSVITLVQPATINFYQPTFTPDGEFVYYVAVDKGVGTLYRIPALGGESKKIIVDVDSKAAFSPDGERFAFIRHNANEGGETIFIANRDGTSSEAFLQSKEIDSEQITGIDWSLDGEKILLGMHKNESKPNQTVKVAAVSIKDKKLEVIGDKEWYDLRSFESTKNGTGIILVGKTEPGANLQIWHLDYPSGQRRQITNDTNDYNAVSVSSDGNSMVATRIEALSGIWSIDPKTKETTQLMSESNNLHPFGGISQSYGGTILYAKSNNKEVNIFSMDENGGNEKQLTSGNETNSTPTASPDGRYIVFVSNRSGYSAIWRMKPDGSDAVQLTTGENVQDLQPEVTADSKTIVFLRQNINGGKAKLMRISIDGGKAVPLFPDSKNMENLPKISADGKRIAYTSWYFDDNTASVISAIKVAAFDGEKVELPETELKMEAPLQYKWTPDGKSLTYINKKTGVDNIWSISIDDGKQTALTNFNVGSITDFHWSIDGQKLFIIKAVFNSNLVLIKDGSKGF